MTDNNLNSESKIPESNNNIHNVNLEEIIIDDKLRSNFFWLLCIEYCMSCCDGGVIPQQNGNIKQDFGGDQESKVGLFSSVDFIGRIIGAVLMSLLIERISRRLFFSGCLFFKCFTLIIPLFTKDYFTNTFVRLLSGIPQTLLTSYGTIWTDQFGKRNRRSLMLPILQFATLIGFILGYILGILCNAILGKSTYGWRLSFSIEGISLAVLGVIFLFYPKLYFSSTFYLNENDDNKGKEDAKRAILKENDESQSLLKQFPKIICQKLYIFMSI